MLSAWLIYALPCRKAHFKIGTRDCDVIREISLRDGPGEETDHIVYSAYFRCESECSRESSFIYDGVWGTDWSVLCSLFLLC